LVLLEALASGLPVITAETTGGSETVVDRAGVRLPDPEDSTALAEAIQFVLGSPERRASMSLAARQAGCENTWESVGDRYVALYRSLCA